MCVLLEHMKSQYIPLDALSATLGLPRNYLRALAMKGDIPHLNVNGRMRFSERQVREKLDAIALEPEMPEVSAGRKGTLVQGT